MNPRKGKESMTEPSGLYPELFRQLQRKAARGKEAEKLLRLGDETFPKEMLDELINIGRQAQVRLDKFQSRQKYYTEKYPSGPWSRALYQIRTGKPFKEEEFQNDHKKMETRKEVEEK
jgi:hypothetical protein